MKRISCVITVAAALWLMTGCSSSPSSSRYIEAEAQSIEPTQTASEALAQTDNTQPDAPASPNQAEPTQQSEKTEEPTPEASPKPSSEPAKKLTKNEKVQEAKKKNEATAKAVTDSIMDNNADEGTAKAPEASSLKEPIEKIRSLVKDLKQHAEDQDAEKIKTVSSLIVQDWDAMKPDVDASFPDMSEFLQEKIVRLDGLLSNDPIDAEAVLQLDYELYQAFRQLADKAGA